MSMTLQSLPWDQAEAETSLEITPSLCFFPSSVPTGLLPDQFLQVALP